MYPESSAYEYQKEGVTPEMMADAINQVKDLGVDLIDRLSIQ